jgi:hypothetical protein
MPRGLSTEADPLTWSVFAFRWPLYADESRACVNHFTNLAGLASVMSTADHNFPERTGRPQYS